MSPRPARSTTKSSQRGSLAQRGADYFGMSGPAEFIAATALFVLLIALSILNVLHRSFDSDESQHLHVIWGWTRGFVQYRDNFDNHMPLFHIMFAPVAGLIGERPTILYWMRFILLPMYFVAAWCTYQIGTRLFSPRAGVWAVLGVAFFSRYYSSGFEFRTDNLWTPIWLLCVTVLIGRATSMRRALVAGLLLGLCFGVSMKSTVLLFSLLLGAPVALVVASRGKFNKSWANLVQCAVLFLAATAIVPAIIMIFFALKGVWRDFRYGVFDFNFLTDRLYKNPILYKSHPAVAVIIFLSALFVAALISQRIARASHHSAAAFPRALIFLVCATYVLALRIFWPPISRTYSPFYPLAFVMCSGALLALSDRLASHEWRVFRILQFTPLPACVALAEFFLLLGTRSVRKDGTRSEATLLRNVLALTEPSDYIFDAKGETIFRQRCFRPVLERITMKAIRQGIIADTTPEQFAETHTCVVATIMVERFSWATRHFVKHDYLPVTHNLRVAGTVLKSSPENPRRCNFEVVIPATYKIISRDASVSGTLDGTPYIGARFLAAGPHTFDSASTPDNLVLLWSQAVDRHFTPFHSLHL